MPAPTPAPTGPPKAAPIAVYEPIPILVPTNSAASGSFLRIILELNSATSPRIKAGFETVLAIVSEVPTVEAFLAVYFITSYVTFLTMTP